MGCNAMSYRWKETGSRFPTDSLKKKRLYLPSKSYPELNQPKWSVKIGALGLTSRVRRERRREGGPEGHRRESCGRSHRGDGGAREVRPPPAGDEGEGGRERRGNRLILG